MSQAVSPPSHPFSAAPVGTRVEGRVTEVVKGGLVLDVGGERAFLPASLVDQSRVDDLSVWLGQTLQCEVIEGQGARRNLVVSRKRVLEQERRRNQKAVIGSLQPGDRVQGVVSNIVDFGVFCRVQGVEMLAHVSELSWDHVSHPSDVVSPGDTLELAVLDVDVERGRVSLSLKACRPDPCAEFMATRRVGDELEGVISRVAPFGVFLRVAEGVEGLVHIDELDPPFPYSGTHLRDVYEEGDPMRARIKDMDADTRRLSLSQRPIED